VLREFSTTRKTAGPRETPLARGDNLNISPVEVLVQSRRWYLSLPSRSGRLNRARPGIRLKAIRDGIQDYEYVQILQTWARSPLPVPSSNRLRELDQLDPRPNATGR